MYILTSSNKWGKSRKTNVETKRVLSSTPHSFSHFVQLAHWRGCREKVCGSRHQALLTAVLLLLHVRAGAVVAVSAVWGHRGQQGVAGGNRWQGVVPYQLLHFTGPGAPVGVPSICRNLVEGDGTVVEVQCGWRGHVRSWAVLVELWGAVAKHGLLFNGSGHELWRTDGWGWHHSEAVSPGLDLQLLDEYTSKQNMS